MPTHHHPARHPISLERIAERIARENARPSPPPPRPAQPAAPVDGDPEWIARQDAYKRQAADPRNHVEPTPEAIRERVKRTALVPAIITVPCADHDAAPGEFCYRGARGVCAARIIARAALR